jgi:putative NADH-flavin reductase
MKLALFGATGGTGTEILKQAIAAGHTVVALVRDPSKLTLPQIQLTTVTGDVLNQLDVDKVVAGADAVICSLGNTSNNPDLVVSTGTRHIVDAMQRFGVERLLVVSSLGVGDSKDQVPFFFKALTKTVLRKAMQDKEVQEQIVRDSGLAWTIVRPGGLTDDAHSGRYQVGTDPSIMAGRIARADVADFVLHELTRNEYIHQAPAIT